MANVIPARRGGFSLIELLMVVAILGIISTIALPVLMSARARAIDAKSLSSLRAVVSAEYAYYANHGSFGTLADLASPAFGQPQYLDQRFLTGELGNNIRCSLAVRNGGSSFLATCFCEPRPPYHYYTADDTGLITETR